jgi:hypothetical protein
MTTNDTPRTRGTQAQESMTGRTQNWDAQTLTATDGTAPSSRRRSRAALAARSWGKVEELPEGSAERFTSAKAHFAEFAPQRVCRLRSGG